MLSSAVFGNKIATVSIISITSKTNTANANSRTFTVRFPVRSSLESLNQSSTSSENEGKPTVILNSLRVLEWEKLCDVVSSFAGTSSGRQATKEQLWSLDLTCQESLRLLEETNAAVEIHKHCGGIMDFSCIDVLLVRSAIEHARKGSPIRGKEAMAVAVLLQFAEALKISIKVAVKGNADLYSRFMPLAQLILDCITNRSLVSLILQLIDEDGSVKDTASSKLKRARVQVQDLETRLYQLMDTLIANQLNNTSSLEVSNIDGRWCIKSSTDQLSSFEGLLLTSGSNVGSSMEPLSAIPLNDELQHAKALVADAEAEVLLELTAKMQSDLDDMENLLNSTIQLDMINARATYSLSFGGTCPDLLLPEDMNGSFLEEVHLKSSNSSKREWKLYLPKAFHPLLLQQHRLSLQKARMDVVNAKAEIRRRRLNEEYISQKEETVIDLLSLQSIVTKLEEACPIAVDFLIAKKTRVLLISGPNMGGKTISLKTVGLAAMMAKSGLYILCSEPAQIPWFDFVFADIGDEQSLSQSLSTFTGHLKQISDIQVKSTGQSLVLLDEIGAGTNPLEGAALGMSILESFSEAGALLTLATTHHGELKTLKYSNDAFENACMEFDEVKLKPTYKILWGVPGRSNAINIAERLCLPKVILDNTREGYGGANTEINEVIVDMEKLKQLTQEHIHVSQHYLMLSRDLYEKLLSTQKKCFEYSSDLKYKKWQQVSEIASIACSILHKKMRQHRASAFKPPQPVRVGNDHQTTVANNQHFKTLDYGCSAATKMTCSTEDIKNQSSGIPTMIPKIGDTVHVASLGTNATVVKVDSSNDEIVVQAAKFKDLENRDSNVSFQKQSVTVEVTVVTATSAVQGADSVSLRIQSDVYAIKNLSNNMNQLIMGNTRATYNLSFRGTWNGRCICKRVIILYFSSIDLTCKRPRWMLVLLAQWHSRASTLCKYRLIYKVVLMIIGEGEGGDVDTSSEESLRSTLSLIFGIILASFPTCWMWEVGGTTIGERREAGLHPHDALVIFSIIFDLEQKVE
ncbi:hypothetical protein Nepgr_010929 [Nepenthes gracilis]|uniref:DNA mismatch repair proteins mutS family domain-containing protein n=1 Tax=Nepenthes gracilis TaxID=150966 RepID=A0AAD3XLS9_NEPGR|nr:hypothetical protein Nepgr_010929 [Nepenthes gracilis]